MVHLLLTAIYLAFVSLGLPDGLLGAAWPVVYPEFGVPVSYAGVVAMIIAVGTIASSLLCDRLLARLGAGKLTAISVGMTALALLGFSVSGSFWLVCLWAVPYGLGAGSVDAALNNYVAVHYESKHMNWLHCMWGIGASVGPYIMSLVLSTGLRWNLGYRVVGLAQIALTALLVLSLPLWKHSGAQTGTDAQPRRPLRLPEILAIPGAKAIMFCFFCYCAMEQTIGLWATSYLALYKGVPAESAAAFGSMFFLGITVGRAVSGFVAMKLGDDQMIWLGLGIIAAGVAVMLLPGPGFLAICGILIIGLGCAPIYPAVIHSTPARFGTQRSQAIIGVQMASAYVGSCLTPPLFGALADAISVALLPWFLAGILGLFVVMFRLLTQKTA